MVQPEFKPFNFLISDTSRFYVMTNSRKYIDFTGSAMTTGYNFIKPEWLVSPVSRLVFKNPYTEELKEKLLNISGFENVAFTTSGTEACDVALSRNPPPILSFEGAYHGLTFLTKIVSNGTGVDKKNKIVHLKYPISSRDDSHTIEADEQLISKAKNYFNIDGASIIIELIQSDGGMNIASNEFIKYINEVVDKYSLKLIVDEVYTGYGRSGELLLFKKYNMKPDMVCIGKGMAAGLPLGAVLYNGEWELPHNDVISMQSANMFIARVGVEVLKKLDEKILKLVRENGNSIVKSIQDIKSKKIIDVRGRGFMIGVELSDTETAYNIRNILEKNGVLCSLVGEKNNVLKITPPVLIDKQTLTKGINIIVSTLNEIELNKKKSML
ncbi:MAG: aminotransferase class III-fold pyridoxal phosphate-dependent enzyme [Thermoplasmata archaeon]